MSAALEFGTEMHLWTEWIEPGDARRPALALAYVGSSTDGATSMTMAEWSLPKTGTTWKSTTRMPCTNPWSMRSSRGAAAQGPQVGCGRSSKALAATTAASVNWAEIRRYTGQMGVALKSPITERAARGLRSQ